MIMLMLATAIWLGGSVLVSRTREPRQARGRATMIATCAVAVAVLGAVVPIPIRGDVPADAALVGVLVGLVGLVAVALAPVVTHPPAVLVTVLRLSAVSSAFATFRGPGVEAVLWVLSAWLVWSGLRSRDAGLSRLFLIHHGLSAVLFAVGAALTPVLPETARYPLAAAVAIRLGAVPFHTWLPSFTRGAPIGVVVAFGATPLVALRGLDVPVMVLFGVLTALVGTLAAVVVTDAERALAYLLISNGGLLLAAHTSSVGAGFWRTTVLAWAGLAMTIGVVRARRGTTDYGTGGDLAATPRLAVAVLVFGLAAIGFPLLPGFLGAHDLLHDVSIPVASALVAALCVNGVTVMRIFFGLFAGGRELTGERDLTPLENYAVTALGSVLVVVGLIPALLGG